jgi:hypothetical protein
MHERLREAIVPTAYGITALCTFRHYGMTFDEAVQSYYGELTLRYFRSGFTDHAAQQFSDLKYYGPLFETIAAAVYSPFMRWKYDIRHLLIAITALITIVAVGRLAKLADADPLVAQLALVMLPQFWGHSFVNSKDIPFACTCALAALAFARIPDGRWQMADGRSNGDSAIRHPPSAIGRACCAGIAAGAALAIRPGGAVFFVMTAIVVVALTRRLKPMFVAGLVAWAVMVAVWPWAHLNPILNPIRAVRIAASFTTKLPVLFEGRFIGSDLLPRRYLAEMLAITTPLPILILALAGVVFVRGRTRVLVAAWMIVPIVLFTIWKPNVYDGIRHFLFLLPFFAVSCAVAAREIVRRWPRALPAVLLVLALSIIPIVRLHPYEMTYYNTLVGGTGGAATRFDTDYWLSSYREAAAWLRANACPNRPTRVLVAATQSSIGCLRYYLPHDRFVVSLKGEWGSPPQLPPAYDYYVGTTRWGLAAEYKATPVAHVIERDGAAFTVIRGRCR